MACTSGCGLCAFGSHATCCTECKGPDGPHKPDCSSKNKRLQPACERRCGRPAFASFKTCCTRCKGDPASHAGDCTEKCMQQAADTIRLADEAGAAAARGRASAAHKGYSSGKGAHQKGLKGGGKGKPAGGKRGRRFKALLIGINYEGTRAQLRGCINDVHNIKRLLVETYGWDERGIRTLTDSQATHRNITDGLQWLARGVQSGDALLFHFSGHGAQQEDPNGYEEDGMNETILPVDFQKAGMITDDMITDVIVAPLPECVRLTAVMDCCHSGTGLDLPYVCTKKGNWKREPNPFFSAGDVQLFSGCEDHATSADCSSMYAAPGGACTTAFCNELRKNPEPSYTMLIKSMNDEMKRKGLAQRPQLSSSQSFDFHRKFTLVDSVRNSNPTLGRIFEQKFPPRPKPLADGDPLKAMLLAGGAAIGGMIVADMIGDALFGGLFGGLGSCDDDDWGW